MESYEVWLVVFFMAFFLSLAGVIAGLVLSSNHPKRAMIWKISLILLVIFGSMAMLTPPSQKLIPGLDLSGGTRMVYTVDVGDSPNPAGVVEQVIDVLKDRADPTGARNLIWRPLAGNRIEVQMAHASPEIKRRRAVFESAREALLEGNLSFRQLDAAIRGESEGLESRLLSLAGGNDTREQLLSDLASAIKAEEAARQPYVQAQEQYDQAKKTLEAMTADPDSEAYQQAKAAVERDLADRDAKIKAFVDARNKVQSVRDEIGKTNVEASVIDGVLLLLNTKTGKAEKALAAFNEAIDGLKQEHPSRADELAAVCEAYISYEKVKGPLDDPNDLIALLKGAGVLEFRIAAPPQMPEEPAYRQQLRTKGPRTLVGPDGLFKWFVIDDPKQFTNSIQDQQIFEENPVGFFTSRGYVVEQFGEDLYMLLYNKQQVLDQSVEGWELSTVYRAADRRGFAAVGFGLNSIGAAHMAKLTGDNLQKPMAIVLDGKVKNAPTIQSAISNSGIITGGSGGFSDSELRYLIRTLGSGSIQGQLGEEPDSIETTGAAFGQDNLHAGVEAARDALIVVAFFMAVYYLFAGMVANFALVLNMLVILGVMATIKATFTLPGIAGIVLTIGMAVDANVLIFERIREELEAGTDVRTSVRLGFQRALSTILDANITTLFMCLVLAKVATTEIKGFAVTLGIGIVATLFTALFCSRVIIDIYLKITNAKSIGMLPTIVKPINSILSPKINWVGKRYAFFGLSVILVVAGLSAVVMRGGDMLDIEFRSGTQVKFDLAEDDAGNPKMLSVPEVRERLDKAAAEYDLPLLSGKDASVVTVGQVDGIKASSFSIATLEVDADKVSTAVKDAFSDVLDVKRRIDFTGRGDVDNVPTLGEAPVYRIENTSLGQNINRPEITTNESEYLGGVVIVMDNMDPVASIEDIEGRIRRILSQGDNPNIGYRKFTVVGLDQVSTDEAAAVGEQVAYSSVAILMADAETNYVDHPEAFQDKGGLADTSWEVVRDAMLRDTSLGGVNKFSPQVSGSMKARAIIAIIASLLIVVVYIWFRFGSLRYGLGAIVALAHDVLIALGLVAIASMVADSAFGRALLLTDFKVDLALVAALLTIIGYSLNDTIVIYDRIRENRGRRTMASGQIINDSINQTFSRTLITSGTTLLALLTLYIFGGDGVHGFAFSMIVGVVVGTYSSVAIASPLLLVGRDPGELMHAPVEEVEAVAE